MSDSSPPEATPYSSSWAEWTDPAVPEAFNPIELLVERHMQGANRSKTAVVLDGKSYSYGDLHDYILRADAGLQELNLHPGSRLLLFATDSLEFISFWLAAIRRGITPAAVPDQSKAERLWYFIRDSGASALYIDSGQLGKLSGRDFKDSELHHLIVRRQDPSEVPTPQGIDVRWADDLLACAPTARPAAKVHHQDVSYMLYSGSTTGDPKGIVHLTHDFVYIPERQGAFWEYREQDVVYATSKKYFTHGLWPGVLIPLYYGATVVMSSEPVTAGNLVRTIQRDRPTKLITVPPVITAVVQEVEREGSAPDFSSLELVVTASEKIPDVTSTKFREFFGLELLDSIGSAEVTYEWIANRPAESKRASLGKPVFGYRVKLVDENGATVDQPGVPGEAWISSVTTCPFYWRKLEKTRASMNGEWFRTGDVLYFDDEGFFHFVGRGDDLFKSKGLWVSPVEIESAIVTHPSVLNAAVVRSLDASGLAVPKAFVQLDDGTEASEDLAQSIRDAVRNSLGGYKAPNEVVFLSELPRTPTGKLDRRALADLSEVESNGPIGQ